MGRSRFKANTLFGLLLVGIVLLNACASDKSLEQLVEENRLSKLIIPGQQFSHVLIARHGRDTSGKTLHVYIEGDGTPWARHDVIAVDPTAHNPLALKLMVQDPTSSVYLGRPCYNGLSTSPPCSPALWTHRRYAKEVIDSMQAALQRYLDQKPYIRLTFIGYSGGGVLAMLLAERFASTEQVITIAANLDIDAWTRHHRYSSLEGSLNPAKRPPLPGSIKQTHFAGKGDTNVPLAIIKYVSSLQSNSSLRIKENFNHICCWESEWQDILRDI